MKRLKAHIDSYFVKLDNHWQALPMRKQHQYILYFFWGYLLVTLGATCKVWYDTSNSGNDMIIEHIENPVLKSKDPAKLQDSASTILKNKIYARQ